MNTHAAPIKCDDLVIRTPASSGLTLKASSVVRTWFGKISQRWNNHRELRTNRKAFQTMLRLDDTMLNDIGVTRSEVQWANSLPLSVNAAVELNNISLMRRRAESPK